MHQFIEFVIRHWELWLIFIIVLGYWIGFEIHSRKLSMYALSVQAAVNLINHHNAVVIDTREEKDFQQGHILHALSLSEKKISDKNDTLKKYYKNKLILLGNSDSVINTLVSKLTKQGFNEVYYLKGGLTSWQEAGLPLHKE